MLRLVAAMVALCLFGSAPGRAAESGALTPPPALPPAALPPAPPPAPPGNPALDVSAPAAEQPHPSVFRRWWFWTAVGAAAAATVVVIVVSSRGHAPPATDLGNQEFEP